MTYFKVDDGIWGHPKFALLSNDAVALWTMAGSWCGRYQTDGHLPFQSLALVRGSKQAAQELVDAGLWLTTPDGYLFHDWDHYQYTKAENEARKQREREKKRRQRAGVSLSVSPGDITGDSPGESQKCPGEGEGEGVGISSSSKNEDAKKEPMASVTFNEFWSVYPRKVGKQDSYRAWGRALKLADAQTIIDGAQRFRDDPNREAEFTPHPTTWLNQGRWEDDPLPPRSRPRSAQQARSEDFAATMEWAKAQDARRGLEAVGGISDTGEPFRALSVAPSGNHDDSWLEAR